MMKKLHSFTNSYCSSLVLHFHKHNWINKLRSTFIVVFALMFNVCVINSQTDIAVNGGFETGDFTGWTQFVNGTLQTINTTNPSEGTYCAQLNNQVPAVASVIKNANVGIGTALANQEVTITLDARGTTAAGGVVFVKIISELDGGGISKDQLFGPLSLDADANTWKSFSFVSILGNDVSGGVSLELTATTGGDAASEANIFFDNVKIILTAVADPTCDDGIKNGDETGVDCGGSICGPCAPTCSDGIQNGDETGVDCGGTTCGPCPAAEPTVSAPIPTTPEGEVISVYSDTYTTNTVSGFVFQDFSGGGPNSQVDIENDGNMTAKIQNLSYYGPAFGAIDLSVEESPGVPMYNWVHFDYYATTSTELRFYVIDGDLGACCGDAREPRYKIALSGGDELLESGVWKSVNIPLSYFMTYPDLAGLTWNGNPVSQLKFEGNGNFYYDNIYFSKNQGTTLGINDFDKALFSAYPNPTKDSWTVKTNDINIYSIEVYDILGKQVQSIKPNTSEAKIDASKLSKGLYFATVKTEAGSESLKLIKN